MKKISLVSLAVVLIASLAAPAGAVFAVVGSTDESPAAVSPAVLVEVEDRIEDGLPNNEPTLIVETPTQDDTIPPPPAAEPAPAEESPILPQYAGVVVTQVQTSGGTGRTNEELIEIHNNTLYDVDVTGWSVLSASEVIITIVPEKNEPGYRVVLPPKGSAVFVTDAFRTAHLTAGVVFAADGIFANGKITNASGSVRIVDGQGVYVSGVAWGSGIVADGRPMASLPAGGGVIERKATGDGYYMDTRDNAVDYFSPSTLRAHYQAGMLIEVFDQCLNMAGVQDLLPDGLYRTIEGNCEDMPPATPSINACETIVISEIGANMTDQFIEVHNTGAELVTLDGCQLQTNRSEKLFIFEQDTVVDAGEYKVVAIVDTDLTLTKTTSGTVYLLSSDGKIEVDAVSYKNLAKDTSWSLIDGQWRQSYAVTPGESNVYQQYPPCDEGYWRNSETGRCNRTVEVAAIADCGEGRERNPLTGRCRNIPAPSELVPCREGQYRSEETNRCRSIAAAASTLKPCADDQFRNPQTNRCKKIASSDDVALADCGEGRERNPQTNRCRNILASTPATAGFKIEPIKDAANTFVGWWALGGVTVLAIGYAGWEWREEVSRFVRKVAHRGSK